MALAKRQGEQRIECSKEEVLEVIKSGQQGRSLREYAEAIGVSAAYLSDVYLNRRSPGKSILDHFDIEKERKVIVTYIWRKKEMKC